MRHLIKISVNILVENYLIKCIAIFISDLFANKTDQILSKWKVYVKSEENWSCDSYCIKTIIEYGSGYIEF